MFVLSTRERSKDESRYRWDDGGSLQEEALCFEENKRIERQTRGKAVKTLHDEGVNFVGSERQ